MPVPVISLDKYLSGWDFSNSLLQLVGINCTAFDQLEKNDPVRDVLDFNNFVCPVLWQQFTVLALKNLNLQSLPIRLRTWLCSRKPINLLFSCTPRMLTRRLYRVSTNSASLPFMVTKFQVATLIFVLV